MFKHLFNQLFKNHQNNRPPKPLSEEQLSHFFEQLAMLLSAGITPEEGLDIMLRDKDNVDLAGVCRQLQEQISHGMCLSESLQASGVFPSYAIRLLHIGELTGHSDSVCASLAGFYASEDELRASIRDAFYYPMIMALMMFVLVVVLLSRVLPIFRQVFRQLGASVSGVSSLLMDISDALSRYYILFLAVFLALAAAFFYFNNTRKGRQQLQQLLQKMTLTKGLSEEIAIGRFAAGMQLTQASGMDTYESLTICRTPVENDVVAARIDRCMQYLEGGDVLADALAKAEIFSSFYSSMIRVASLTGNADTVMGYIARHYQEDSNRRIDTVLARIEPAMVAVLAIVIGMILLSVILPLMSIMSSIG